MQSTLSFDTPGRSTRDITEDINAVVREAGVATGVCHVFIRHTSASLMICENADPDVRGQGIGRALIEAVYKAADEAGSPDVYWMTQEFNKVGRRLYDRISKLTPFIEYNRY